MEQGLVAVAERARGAVPMLAVGHHQQTADFLVTFEWYDAEVSADRGVAIGLDQTAGVPRLVEFLQLEDLAGITPPQPGR